MKTHLYSYRLAFIRAFQFSGFEALTKILGNLAKRIFDIIMAGIGFILLSPIFALIAIMIKRNTPGPVFYRGLRMGQNGHMFRMLKFRTMYECPQSYAGLHLTCKDDPRITPLGSWLRHTKLNELPQLWNVLIGEMSFVGPRPEDPEIAKNWPEETRSKILSVKPGITSPASILYHDEEKLLSQKDAMSEYFKSILPDKLRLDLLYVRHHAFFSDIDTIFWTIAILLPRWSKAKIPEGHFFAGPVSRLIHCFLTWFVIDFLETLVAVSTIMIIWQKWLPLNWGGTNVVLLAFLLAILFSGVNSVVGLNRIVWSQATMGDIVGLMVSCWFVTFFVLAANYLEATYHWLNLPPLPTSMIFIIGLLLQVGFIVTRYRSRLLMMLAIRWLNLRQENLAIGERVLIVGNGEGSQIAQWLLGRQMFRTAFSIIGMVNDDDPRNHGMRVNGCWMLGDIKGIPDLIKKHDIGVVLSTTPAVAREVNKFVFDVCQKNNIRLIFLNDLLRMVERQVAHASGSFEYPIWVDEGLEFKAMHDSITNLPNRYLFCTTLKHSMTYAKRYSSRMAVIFVKLNGMDSVEKKFGCKSSDHILIKTALQLAQCKRASDTLARVGECKFGLILENIRDDGTAEIAAKRMLASVSEILETTKQKFDIDADINVYLGKNGFAELESACFTEMETET